MRPQILYPLYKSLESLPGVGSAVAAKLKKRIGDHPVDLCFHLPHRVEERILSKIGALKPGTLSTIIATIGEHQEKGRRYQVHLFDDTGDIALVFFHGYKSYLAKMLPPEQQRLISGKIDYFYGQLQMVHPDHIGRMGDEADWVGFKPLYPYQSVIGYKTYHKIQHRVLNLVPHVPEWLDAEVVAKNHWPTFREALFSVHRPKDALAIDPLSPARMRLAYDEFLAYQIALGLLRLRRTEKEGIAFKGSGAMTQKLRASLPFVLTAGQDDIIQKMQQRMAQTAAMMSLLMGDVGSGKTIVAIFGMLNAIECGAQVTVLAPTEILAQQHFETISAFLAPLDLTVESMMGKTKSSERKRILTALKSGAVNVLVGTHAILEEGVEFQNLGFIVIDEQHRFGVEQRLKLIKKGDSPDVLIMSATPIPRTLLMTLYGEMDVYQLREKPKNRLPILTRVMAKERIADIYQGLGRMLDQGGKVYWVCPLIEGSDDLDMAAVKDRYEDLLQRFGSGRVLLLHGQMKSAQKEQVMQTFKQGPPAILVSTTVIEVGVDVSDAQVMIIEEAERFGLAQLHQLRGRVGRGDKASSCVLLYKGPLSEIGQKRLEALRESSDGFEVAEMDLKLRGGGELLGTKQSGLPSFKMADPYAHYNLLHLAREEADAILKADPDLVGARGKSLRVLLHLFGHQGEILPA